MSTGMSASGIGVTSEQIAAVRAPLARAALLPSKVYSDPDIFRLGRPASALIQ